MQPPAWVPSENIAKVARLPVFSRAWNLSHRDVGELALTMERGAKREHLPSRPDADRAIRISSLGEISCPRLCGGVSSLPPWQRSAWALAYLPMGSRRDQSPAHQAP